ncbi:MAG: hypothetical protein H0X34_13620 [Chthoniobacterales bacterium]|jgi:predicted O-methyltransferase YrrM|nr:hypothetical protein [Chthoniobacterales bacterium]
MRYIHGAVGSAYVPKLLGLYERELNQYIEQACALHFPLIVDIGAAEGYYAVGLARRNPHGRVIAFEMEERGRAALKQMAQLNEVTQRVDVRGKCELEDLQCALTGADRSLVVCDVEGYEEDLLEPKAIPALARAHLLVEMHDFIRPGITEVITKRFTATHHIQRIWQEPRNRSDMPYRTLGTTLLPGRYLDWAVSEWRPVRMSWLWIEPHDSNGAST